MLILFAHHNANYHPVSWKTSITKVNVYIYGFVVWHFHELGFIPCVQCIKDDYKALLSKLYSNCHCYLKWVCITANIFCRRFITFGGAAIRSLQVWSGFVEVSEIHFVVKRTSWRRVAPSCGPLTRWPYVKVTVRFTSSISEPSKYSNPEVS